MMVRWSSLRDVTFRRPRWFSNQEMVITLRGSLMLLRCAFSICILAVAACGGSSPLASAGHDAVAADVRVRGPAGLEQHLTVTVDPDDFRQPGAHTVLARSTITNTGSSPVSVAVRVCRFDDSDFQTSAELSVFEELKLCAHVRETIALPAGASTEPLELRARVESGSGVYKIRLRHALSPEFRAEASFRIP